MPKIANKRVNLKLLNSFLVQSGLSRKELSEKLPNSNYWGVCRVFNSTTLHSTKILDEITEFFNQEKDYFLLKNSTIPLTSKGTGNFDNIYKLMQLVENICDEHKFEINDETKDGIVVKLAQMGSQLPSTREELVKFIRICIRVYNME